ncbi:probable low affinity copper uptake protein 2 [Daktulosphaira vitifoliae]|uniref:probable low affinity copper uptake protein 2 n=1 Tax=Daktulosphaira vitifoliae TaxID=58002 RepID=UPI0021AAC669|nr:probable low affinity copper uptake protein 2 [Daktulosphaira vitifoliae]
MSFTFSSNIEPFLINNFNIQSFIGLVTVCVGLMALAIIFESLKTVHYMTKVHKRLLCCSQPGCKEYVTKEHFSISFKMRIIHCVKALGIYLLQMLIGYILMCAVMTYNVLVFIAIVGGYGLGYWIFGLTMMHIAAKNLLKSKNVSVKCKTCAVAETSRNEYAEESTNTELSDDTPGTSSTVVVEVHKR